MSGLYAKDRRGDVPQFAGISSPYEEPTEPAVVIDTSLMEIDEAVAKIIDSPLTRN